MDEKAARWAIKLLHDQGNSATQIHEILVATYGDSAPSFATCFRWSRRCRWGQTDLEDTKKPEREKAAMTEETIDFVNRLIKEDRR